MTPLRLRATTIEIMQRPLATRSAARSQPAPALRTLGITRASREEHSGPGQREDREAGEQAALGVAQADEPATVERAEASGIEPREEIHPEPVGELLRPIEAERLADGDVRREQRRESEREDAGPERTPADQAPAERAGLEQHASEPDGEQQEAVRERVVEGREALPPEGEHEHEQVAPARPVEKAQPGPEAHREEKPHLDHRAVEVLEAIREEREDDASDQARDRAVRERPGERRR